MHTRLLVTISMPANSDSAEVRSKVFDTLKNDDTFSGGGIYHVPMCDSFVIGGRWTGELPKALMSRRYRQTLRALFPPAAKESYSFSFTQGNEKRLNALWTLHGGIGPSPYIREPNGSLGYPDDAMLITPKLYKWLAAEYKKNPNSDCYMDLDDESPSASFIGRKWLVVVDYRT